jgi:4-amino-4-deoxy-L-arabinose transferase-like glycosyltransferase
VTGLALLGLVGFGLIVLSTRWGAGLDPDSTVYVRAARGLVAGRGVALIAERGRARPLTRFPPLYPALLATGAWLGREDPRAAARWVGASFFSASVLLVGMTVATGGGAPWAAALAATLMALSPDMLRIHSMALSEAPFLFFSMLTLYLLASYLDRPSAASLVASAVAASLASLTRYAGVVLIVTGVLALFLLVRGRFVRRALTALVFGVLSCAVPVAWTLRNLHVAGTIAERTLALHPPTWNHLTGALETISGWLLPGTPLAVRTMALLTITASAAIAVFVHRFPTASRDQEAPAAESLPRLIAVYLISYLFLLGFTISLVSADTRLDFRMLSPVYVVLIILVAGGCSRLEGRARATAWVLLVPVLGAYLNAAAGFVRQAHFEGQGYASRSWQESPTLTALQALPASTPIFSNRPDAIAVLTGRPAGRIPANYNPSTLRENPNRSAEIAQLRQKVRDRKGVVVVFKKIGVRGYLMSEAELSVTIPLLLVKRTRDGAIYRWDSERSGAALDQRSR